MVRPLRVLVLDQINQPFDVPRYPSHHIVVLCRYYGVSYGIMYHGVPQIAAMPHGPVRHVEQDDILRVRRHHAFTHGAKPRDIAFIAIDIILMRVPEADFHEQNRITLRIVAEISPAATLQCLLVHLVLSDLIGIHTGVPFQMIHQSLVARFRVEIGRPQKPQRFTRWDALQFRIG